MTETILVVDSNPIGSKLAAALLRAEGYDPKVASSGEGALSMLVTLRPGVILVDLQLIGMEPSELARRIREDPLVGDTPIMALAPANSSEQPRSLNAGFRGMIAKPLDGRKLSLQLERVLLEGVNNAPIDYAAPVRDVPVERPVPRKSAESDAELADLPREFLEQGCQQARALMEAVEIAFPVRQARFQVQQWIGSADALGYLEIAATARDLAKLLDAPLWDRARTALLLADISRRFRDPIHLASPEEIDTLAQGLSGERIALVGLGQREAERACLGLRRAEVRPYLFDENEPPTSEAIQNCSGVIVQVRPGTAESPWLLPEPAMREAKPLVLMGARVDILALDAAVQARAHDFLIDDWAPEEVALRLGFARARTARKTAARAEAETGTAAPREEEIPRSIVFALDDSGLMKTLSRSLADSGIESAGIAKGSEALDVVRQRRPGAVVLDAELSGKDAFALLAKIRSEKLRVKVLLLTADAKCVEMAKGFKTGADECMVQPINPREFAARVSRLLHLETKEPVAEVRDCPKPR
jgi:DNA-binding response OmpR family regulator